MLDWHVDEELPPEPLVEERSRPPWRLGWRSALLLVLILAAGAAALFVTVRQREAALRTELDAHLLQESRAQASGAPELAPPFADRAAAPHWYTGYLGLYQRRASSLVPTVQEAHLVGDKATVMVRWPTRPPLVEPRAYRLTEEGWRRTPLDLTSSEPPLELRTPHFALTGPPDAVNDLASTPGLQLNLEGLRRRVATYWEETWEEYFLTVRVYPAEFAPAVQYSDARNLHVNTVNLAPFDPASPLSPYSQYRLAITEGVVKWLTTPSWVRQLRLDGTSTMSPADIAASQDWFVMLELLQEAEARYWALSEPEIELVRQQWRAEVGNQWVEPFGAPLPDENVAWGSEESQRRAMVNLLLERQIDSGSVETIGRLARILNGYPPVYFSAELFFSALIGGSPSDVQMQMEMWLENGS